MTRPTARRNLPVTHYPLKIEFISERTGRIVHTIDVPGPGKVEVPALADVHGPVSVRVTRGDGVVEYADSPKA